MKTIKNICYILLLYLLNNNVLAQSSGDYCFRDYKGAVSKIRILDNNNFEYYTLFSDHGYQEIIQKGFFQLKENSIEFTFVEEQFVKIDTLYAKSIEPYKMVGYLSKNEIRIGGIESYLPYRKCKCSVYRRELKKWARLEKKTKP